MAKAANGAPDPQEAARAARLFTTLTAAPESHERHESHEPHGRATGAPPAGAPPAEARPATPDARRPGRRPVRDELRRRRESLSLSAAERAPVDELIAVLRETDERADFSAAVRLALSVGTTALLRPEARAALRDTPPARWEAAALRLAGLERGTP